VWGRPFYAGWGLTDDRLALPRRTRRLDLDELTHGALIAYPLYADPITSVPCAVEDFLDALAALRRAAPAMAPAGLAAQARRLRRWLVARLRTLRAG
jgi:capsular polysaccharide export protein